MWDNSGGEDNFEEKSISRKARKYDISRIDFLESITFPRYTVSAS